MNTVECNNVSIKYITGDFKSIGLKEYVIRHINGTYSVQDFWADKNISFSLQKGDMLGIIGSNGAGKSTLLKAISGILLPTEGCVKTTGTIAALLELTSGFDPDMTVKENTYLRGAMLGYTKKFIEEKYDEIIKFAELEQFQEYQFKHLSSGMKSRLAFSIACLVNPDIIILDEVLSVGDGAFNEKSGKKMREILAGGITGILVSHSVLQIRQLCNKVLWIDKGNQIAFTDEVGLYCDAYEEFLRTRNLPKTRSDIEQLALDYRARMLKEEEEYVQHDISRMKELLESHNEKAISVAIDYLKREKPEIINYDNTI